MFRGIYLFLGGFDISTNRPPLSLPLDNNHFLRRDDAPDPKTRLWLRILHDTGMRKASLLNLRVEDLALEQQIPHLRIRNRTSSDPKVGDAMGCRAFHQVPHIKLGPTALLLTPIREQTAMALRQYIEETGASEKLFPGDPGLLARRLASGLHKASRRAGIKKRVYPSMFREMKVLAFEEAGVRPDVVANAMGWTRAFGLPRSMVGRWEPEGTLGEAAEVLGMAPDVPGVDIGEILKHRFVEWVMG